MNYFRKESIIFFVPFLILAVIFLYFNHYKTMTVFFLIVAFILYFFRDPVRVVPEGAENFILSPADGTIIINRPLNDEEVLEYTKDTGAKLNVPIHKISIFMSAFNVHVNRAPVSGVITNIKHKKGSKIPAYYEKSSSKNEHMDFVIQNEKGNIFFRLIAGLIAQRIVSFKQEGDIVVSGDKIGLIKFGSRVDILIPCNWEVQIKDKQKVTAGETILAKFSQK